MKRLLVLLVAAAFALTACDSVGDDTADNVDASSEVGTDVTPTPATDAP